ncbi:MAG: helix-turn-helix domain-containing protein [Candidatus Thiodiazotropha endolucinida]|nr:helix-turn-helix domain-containing protein [Candidatus Thiodiazotropha endolucinida]
MMMKLTPFGEQVRLLRLKESMRLNTMAEALQVSSSYLSGVETGRKELTDKFVDRVYNFFDQRGIKAKELYHLAEQSRKEVKIKTEGMDNESREIVAEFARRFNKLPRDRKREMKQLLLKLEE